MDDRSISETENEDVAELAWWLEESEQCWFCYQSYALEVERRCYECDKPICPICVTTVEETQQVICPECAADNAQ